MMQSNNPVFRRSEEFSRAGATYQGYGQNPYQGDPGMPGVDGPITHTTPDRMTIDTVVQKGAITLGLVLVTAFATWILTPNVEAGADLGTLYLASMGGAGLAFVLSLVNSFKREISPALVLAFAAAEGVALGGISKIFQAFAGDSPIVIHAVLGTFAAFAGTLAVYKFFNIQVGDKFRTMVTAGMFGMVGLGLMEMVLSMFNADLGLFGMGGLGLLFAVAGLVLGVFMLVMDFDFIERGVANGLPEKESWRAVFALTVSLVWIYTNLLRILAIMNQD
ncbi:Bax inhibitor-1/YccA family protein [Nocardioides panacisoli]|uniref:Bax inhibitor-1/YccA family protein n=1 Tax=Nocardioides panacisoli TaxID=627624 RepID=UPI001C630B6A|nr:Bax inhibitor-1/YccA family protein [Nocardioides panacisoli]QYJ02459.1 Bax inhibitor-1/YccA family protein [Nocardioides panacisoli]